MADQLQIRGGDTTANSTFTGAQRELTVDTTKNQLIVHDGVTPGGHPIAPKDDPQFTGRLEIDNGDLYVKNGPNSNNGVLIQPSASTFYGNTLIQAQGIYTTNNATISSLAGMYVGGIKGITDQNITISLESSGAATFAGDVAVGDSTPWSNPTKTGTHMAAGGSVETYRDVNGSTNGAYTAYYKNPNGNNDKVFSVNMDGSAEFAGGATEINSYGQFITTRTDSDSFPALTINGVGTTTGNINLYGTGKASFAGDVTVGDYQSGTAGKNGFELRSSGELVQNRNGGDAYTLYNNSATKTVTISAAGAATFAGQVDCSSDGNNVASLVSNGYVQSNRTAGTSSVFEGQLNGTSTVSIVASGAATFAGTVTTASGVTASNTDYNPAFRSKERDANKYTYWQSANGVLHLGNDIEQNLSGDQPLSGDINIKLDGTDGSATFQGDINKQSNGSSRFVVQESFTRLYTGSPSNFDDYTISLNNNDGSADFAGDVSVGSTTFYSNGAGYFGSTLDIAYAGGSGIRLSASGAGIFSGTVTATNITAFKSRMASAVASAGDLSALKQAILDAVADL